MPFQSIEYCYSLEELFQQSGNIDSVPALSTYGTLIAGFNTDDYWKTGTGYKLWTYIYYTYRDHICVYADKEINPVGNADAARDFWKNFYTIWPSFIKCSATAPAYASCICCLKKKCASAI